MSSESPSAKVPEDGNDSPVNNVSSEVEPPKEPPSPPVSRIQLDNHRLDDISLDDLRQHWKQQDIYISFLESRCNIIEGECSSLKESEEKMKSQLAEASLRERFLMRRLAAKEQDLQEYAGQLSELKSGQVPGGGALRNALVDPAVNLLLQRLRQELAETKTRLDDTQNELAAWKFTPDSNTGKRLMAKCRLLYQENEELGKMIASGRLAKLEGDLALQKSFSEEVKKSQSELDELLQDLDEDVEGMQSTIYYLQQELRKAKETVSSLEHENSCLRSSDVRPKSPPSAPVNGIAPPHSKWCKPNNNDSLDSPNSEGEPESPRTRDREIDDSVVNNNVEGHRKRTSSENSEDNNAVVKKTRPPDSYEYHESDDEIITNGESTDQ